MNVFIEDRFYVAEENEEARRYASGAGVPINVVGDLAAWIAERVTKIVISDADTAKSTPAWCRASASARSSPSRSPGSWRSPRRACPRRTAASVSRSCWGGRRLHGLRRRRDRHRDAGVGRHRRRRRGRLPSSSRRRTARAAAARDGVPRALEALRGARLGRAGGGGPLRSGACCSTCAASVPSPTPCGPRSTAAATRPARPGPGAGRGAARAADARRRAAGALERRLGRGRRGQAERPAAARADALIVEMRELKRTLGADEQRLREVGERLDEALSRRRWSRTRACRRAPARRTPRTSPVSASPRTASSRATTWSSRRAGSSAARGSSRPGDVARLWLAIQRLALDHVAEQGFTLVLPPVLVREETMYGTVFFPTDRQSVYTLADAFLVGMLAADRGLPPEGH